MDDTTRADRIRDQLAKNPKVQQIVADAHLFDSLRNEPGWQRLYAMVRSKETKWMESVTRRLMGPKKNWPKDDEIAYHKGFYEGADFVLAHPAVAEANLERAARVAWAMSFENDTEEDD